MCLKGHIKKNMCSSCRWSFRFFYLNFCWIWDWEILDATLKVILMGSPILTFGATLGDLPMMFWNLLTLYPSKCLVSVNREVSPFYYYVHFKYYVLTWGELPIYKTSGNLHILYGLCVHIILYKSLLIKFNA